LVLCVRLAGPEPDGSRIARGMGEAAKM